MLILIMATVEDLKICSARSQCVPKRRAARPCPDMSLRWCVCFKSWMPKSMIWQSQSLPPRRMSCVRTFISRTLMRSRQQQYAKYTNCGRARCCRARRRPGHGRAHRCPSCAFVMCLVIVLSSSVLCLPMSRAVRACLHWLPCLTICPFLCACHPSAPPSVLISWPALDVPCFHCIPGSVRIKTLTSRCPCHISRCRGCPVSA